ncbi:MAG: YoaK family protein [Alphaproteobacteria bacterium]
MTAEHSRGIALGLLSSTAGVTDGTAFLTLGGVFTSAMSGNTIVLGVALGEGRIYAALHALAAFVGYASGAALATLPLHSSTRGIERTVFIEGIFLTAFAVVWILVGGPAGPTEVYILIALSAVAMGLQGAVGRALALPGVPTIVITSTLTAVIGTVSEHVLGRGRQPAAPATPHQLVSLLAYLLGAVIAGGLVHRLLVLLPFVPVALILVLMIGFRPYLVRP